MATEKWSGLTSRGTVLTTEMNSLANNTTSSAGSAYDNSSNLDRFGLVVGAIAAYGVAPTLDSVIEIYALRSADGGSTYEDGSSSLRPPFGAYVGCLQLYNNTSAQVLITDKFELFNGFVKFIVINRAGQTMAASGSTLTLYTFNRTIN